MSVKPGKQYSPKLDKLIYNMDDMGSCSDSLVNFLCNQGNLEENSFCEKFLPSNCFSYYSHHFQKTCVKN